MEKYNTDLYIPRIHTMIIHQEFSIWFRFNNQEFFYGSVMSFSLNLGNLSYNIWYLGKYHHVHYLLSPAGTFSHLGPVIMKILHAV